MGLNTPESSFRRELSHINFVDDGIIGPFRVDGGLFGTAGGQGQHGSGCEKNLLHMVVRLLLRVLLSGEFQDQAFAGAGRQVRTGGDGGVAQDIVSFPQPAGNLGEARPRYLNRLLREV